MMLPGSTSYARCALHSGQFVTPSHNLVCIIVDFLYGTGRWGAPVYGGKVVIWEGENYFVC